MTFTSTAYSLEHNESNVFTEITYSLKDDYWKIFIDSCKKLELRLEDVYSKSREREFTEKKAAIAIYLHHYHEAKHSDIAPLFIITRASVYHYIDNMYYIPNVINHLSKLGVSKETLMFWYEEDIMSI